MRAALIVIGLILVGVGVWVALGRFTYNDTQTKFQVGDFKVQATAEKAVPAPLGYIGIVIGAGLVIAGAARKT
ncbi:MAG TPA: hypothetical protein VFH52_07210 [Rhodanobacteraceae bacterium]|nr:hypothetical protein [Rhodanobacteraceae bacterium]